MTQEEQEEDPREHLNACEGCDYCNHLMSEYYIACDECGHWMHRNSPWSYFYDPETGNAYCSQCEPINCGQETK